MKKTYIYVLFMAIFVASCTSTNVSTTGKHKMKNQVIDINKQPTPGPAPEVKVGKPQTFSLPNGLKVMVVENHKLPRVSVQLSLDNPPLAEGNKKGVKSILGSMMGNGTSKMSKDKFNEEIEFYGARVNFRADGAYASTLSKYFPTILDFVSQGLLDPLLTESEFKTEKDKMLEGLKADEKNVSSTASKLRDALAYGLNHPFGEFETEKTVNNVTFNDVKSYYKDNFVPNNAYMIVVGDVKFSDVKKLVTKKFSNWEKKALKATNYAAPKNLGKAQINFVNMSNAVQSELATMNVTHLKMTDPDYYAAILANQILGGGGEGRLFLNLREAHGWTYGSYSRIRGSKHVNKFMTTASVRNAVTDSAIVEMLNEVNRIRTELVSAEELKNAKAKYIGNFVMQVEKPEVVARQALSTKTQNLPDDFYENYIKNINAVTPEQIRTAAQKYFSKDDARIVVVGKAEDVLPSLKKLNMPISYFDRFGNQVEAPKVKKIDSNLTAMSVIDGYLDAIGGKAKAKSLKSVKSNFTMTGAAPQPISGEMIQMAPNKSKMVMKMGDMTVMTDIFDGTTHKVSGMMGNSEKTGKDVADKAAKKGIIEQAFYTADEIELAGISEIEGKEAYRIKVKKGEQVVDEYYDTQSGLLLQTVVSMKTQMGEMSMTSSYLDYVTIDGIKYPTKIKQAVGPQNMEMTFKDIQFNKGVTEEDFK